MINFKRDLLPYAGVLVFLAFIFVYFSPMTDGYVLKQGDIDHFQGMYKEIGDHRVTYEEEPYWTDAMFGGMPAYQISAKYQESPLVYLIKVLRMGQYHAVMSLFIAMIAMTVCLRLFKVKPVLSTLGGMVFALSSYHFHLLVAGHTSKMMAIALAPLLVAAIFYTLKQSDLKGRLTGALGVSIVAYLELWANHAQMTYYFLLFIGIVYLVLLAEAFINKSIKSFAINTLIVGVAFVIGTAGNFNLYFKTYDYQKYSMRGGSEIAKPAQAKDSTSQELKENEGLDFDYITNWSYGINESFSYLNPNVTGKGSGSYFYYEDFAKNAEGNARKVIADLYAGKLNQQEAQAVQYMASTYWGKQPSTMGTMYGGAILLFLAILSLFVWKNNLKWAFLGASVLIFMLSWGHNFPWLTHLFIDHFPFYSKFRAVSSILVVINFVIPFMGVIALDRIVCAQEIVDLEKFKKYLLIVAGSLVGLGLIGVFAPTIYADFKSNTDTQILNSFSGNIPDSVATIKAYVLEWRMEDFKGRMWKSIFLILLAATPLYFIGEMKKNAWIIGAILLGVTFIDLSMRGDLYLNSDEDEKGNLIYWKEKKLQNEPAAPSNADISIFRSEAQLNPVLLNQFEAEKARLKNDKYEGLYGDNELREVYNAAQFRVLNQNTHYRVAKVGDAFNDAYTSYYHKSAGGYHAAKLSHYQSLIDYQLGAEYQQLSGIANYAIQLYQAGRGIDSASNAAIQNAFAGLNVLNMMNTKYVIINPQVPAIQNTQAYGHGWSTPVVKVVADAQEEMDQMEQAGLGLTLIRQSEYDKLSDKNFKGNAQVDLIAYKANELTYKVNVSGGKALTVFSEIYYPKEWKAYVDGVEVPIYRVNYVLRALELEAGDHEVIFKFETDNSVGNILVWVLNIFVLGIIAFLAYLKWGKKENAA